MAIKDNKMEEVTREIAHFLRLGDLRIRQAASYALREGKAQAEDTLPALATALQDTDQEVQYNAIMGMARYASKGGIVWAPAYAIFLKDQKVYVTRWKDWWEENKAKYIKSSQDKVLAPKE